MVIIYSNNNLSINGKIVGTIKGITKSGIVQIATGTNAHVRSQVTTPAGVKVLDVPPYVNGKPNCALADLMELS